MMLRYIAFRLLKAIPVVLIAAFCVFMLLKLVPGDPASIRAGADATPAQIAAVRVELGLDGNILDQFVRWLRLAVTGDFGQSFTSRSSVAALVADRLPATLLLAVTATIVVALIGIPLGVISAIRAGRKTDVAVTVGSAVMIGIPDYWLATLGILCFAVWLGVLPPGGYVSPFDNPGSAALHLFLPVAALAARPTAVIARFARSAVLDIARSDFIWTARSKGIAERRIIIRHMVPNALIPVLTVLAVQFGHMLGSTVVIEAIFGWPGLGGLLVNSIRQRDYTVIQAVMLLLVVAFVIINLVADVLYARLDPRIRLGSSA
jgi:peptide/nickel transport system permease protein